MNELFWLTWGKKNGENRLKDIMTFALWHLLYDIKFLDETERHSSCLQLKWHAWHVFFFLYKAAKPPTACLTIYSTTFLEWAHKTLWKFSCKGLYQKMTFTRDNRGLWSEVKSYIQFVPTNFFKNFKLIVVKEYSGIISDYTNPPQDQE